MMTTNQLAKMIIDVSGKRDITLQHVRGQQGARGGNSDNTRLKEVLGWEPSIPLEDGLIPSYPWIDKTVHAS